MNSSRPGTESGEVNVKKGNGGTSTQQGQQGQQSMQQGQQGQQGMQRSPSMGRGLMSFDELDNLFDDFLSRRWPRLFDWNLPTMGMERGSGGRGMMMGRGVPKVDIVERDKEIEVQAELPGIKKEDLDVSINNQIMTIRAITQEEKSEGEGRYLRREMTRGEYQRTLSLPDYVDEDNAKATFKDGILCVTIPKMEKSQRKSIQIQ
jgi:HSP20 family protein